VLEQLTFDRILVAIVQFGKACLAGNLQQRRISHFEPPPSETPNTKLQRNFKAQNTKPDKQMPRQTAHQSVFEPGAWSFFGVWNLEFGACCPSSELAKN
jgi:hypothetical protein